MNLGKVPYGWWSQDMRLKQSMQVSMATLRVATTRHCYTNRVSGDTYHHLPSPAKGREVREQKHSTGMNGTQKQTTCSHTAGK